MYFGDHKGGEKEREREEDEEERGEGRRGKSQFSLPLQFLGMNGTQVLRFGSTHLQLLRLLSLCSQHRITIVCGGQEALDEFLEKKFYCMKMTTRIFCKMKIQSHQY